MTGTWAVLIFVAGGVSALCLRSLLATLASAVSRIGNLPDGTRRRLDRAARANRLDISDVDQRDGVRLGSAYRWDREDTLP